MAVREYEKPNIKFISNRNKNSFDMSQELHK